MKAINDVPAGRKLVTKSEASLIVLYDVKEFMDALELMMNAVGIPFDVPNLASGETGPSYSEWCDSLEDQGAKLRLDASLTDRLVRR